MPPTVARVTPWLADPRATPLNRVWWRVHLAFNHQILACFGEARRTMDEAETITREHGLRSVLFEIYYAEVAPIVSSRDVAASVAALEKLRTVLNPSRRMDVAYFEFQESTVRMLEGRVHDALDAARQAVAIGREVGLPAMQVPHFLVREALCHLELDAIDEALIRYDEAIALSSGVDAANFGVQRGFIEAHRAYREGRVDDAVARLALRTLGEFVVTRDGAPLVSKRKAQKRPLEMLKVLIALGGRHVDASMLTAQLWPDAEGDDAKTSFDSGLYRLRKLLAVDGALTLAEGKLSLNPTAVWLDV